MALQFVLGGSGSGKSEYVNNLAVKLAMQDRKNSIYLIVPDQFTMQTQWQMAGMHPDGGILNIDVLSFSRLPRKVFEEVGQPERMLLDDTGKCLLIKRGALKIKDELHVLSKGMDNAGWSGEVKSVLSEFMQYNVSPEDLEGIIEKCASDALKLKLSDLKILYEAFLKECEDRYITREEILDMFVQRLPLSEKMEGSVVIFDGFTGFTPIQIKAISALLQKAKDVIITFPFDNDVIENPYKITDENYLFDLTKRNISELIKECDLNRIEVKKEIRLFEDMRHKNNSELAFLEKNLFRNENVKTKAGGAIEIYKCFDIDSECHNLCESLIRLIKEKNYRYRDMAVVCADMPKYQKNIEKYLKRYNIPFYMDSNRTIINNPLVRFILSVTDILKNNFKTEDVLKFLRTGISPFEEEETDRLENYIFARGIKGRAKWNREFEYQSIEQKNNEEDLSEMNSLRERFMEIFEEISQSGVSKRKLSKWIEQIYGILESCEVYGKLQNLSEELAEQNLLEEAMEYEGIYDKVIELFESLCDLMGDEIFTAKEFSDILKVGFSEIRIGVLPQSVDSLLVGDMQRTRLKEIKALFILGVNDGNIPKSGTGGGLLSVPDKEELKKAECRLAPTNDELAFIEQLYIYLNLTKPTDKLCLSFACSGGKGESLVPSYLIELLINMYEGLEAKKIDERPRHFIADVKEEAGRLMGLYVNGLADDAKEKRLFEDLSIIKGSEGGKEWCEKIISNAFREYIPKPLKAETARALYGEMLSVSVSTLEQYAKCRYAYFALYGLMLTEREEYGLETADMGNLSHDVLETVGRKLKEEELDFSNAAPELLEKEIENAIDMLINEYNGDILKSDEKTKYYAVQLSRIMKRTVKTLGFQLSKGMYRPESYEMNFRKMYKPDNVILRGRIDRADVYDDGNGNEYVKIIDYKSSGHRFDLKMLEEGLSLQLAVYMKNAVEIIKERHPDKNVLPAAMLYYAIDDPFVDTSEDSEKEIRKKLIPTGAVINDEKIIESLDSSLSQPGTKSEVIKITKKADNNPDKYSIVYDPEQFNEILKKAEEKALELSGEIMKGSIDINPIYNKANDTACNYCSLRGICGFDRRIKGYDFRMMQADNAEEGE